LKKTIQKTSSIKVAFEKEVTIKEFSFENVNKIEKEGDHFKLYTNKPNSVLSALVDFSKKNSNKIISLNTLEPSLEDVFIKLTSENDS